MKKMMIRVLAAAMLSVLFALSAAAELKLNAGDSVAFGHYPQTEDGTDNTPIEWRVLCVRGNKALVISRFGLDAQPYNASGMETTWEDCSLRAWLNGEFMNRAFSGDEMEAIAVSKNDNSKKQHFDWSKISSPMTMQAPKTQKETQDSIFLLSYAEAKRWFGVAYDEEKPEPRAEPTAYALMRGAYTSSRSTTSDGHAAGWWWLRSPGFSSGNAAAVKMDGSLYSTSAGYAYGMVRPAVWLDMKNETLLSENSREEAPELTDSPSSGIQAKVKRSDKIRESGSDSGRVIGKVRTGDMVEVLNSKGSYWKIRSGGVTGYVKGKNLEKQYGIQAGDSLYFGYYPQSAADAGLEPIRWTVLEIRGNRALLISRYGLDMQPYNNVSGASTTWQQCSLRKWLNDDFLNWAFTREEQAGILTTKVDNSKKQHNSAWSTCINYGDTYDKIFLLSYAEARKYFDVSWDDQVNPGARGLLTVYAAAQQKSSWYNSARKTAEWWLRSPGYYSDSPSVVDEDGSLNCVPANDTDIAVRPVLWLDLDSGCYTTEDPQTETASPETT